MVDKERTAHVSPVYWVWRSIFISASPYLIFGERKTVWESSWIANLQNIFYIEGELALHKLDCIQK